MHHLLLLPVIQSVVRHFRTHSLSPWRRSLRLATACTKVHWNSTANERAKRIGALKGQGCDETRGTERRGASESINQVKDTTKLPCANQRTTSQEPWPVSRPENPATRYLCVVVNSSCNSNAVEQGNQITLRWMWGGDLFYFILLYDLHHIY